MNQPSVLLLSPYDAVSHRYWREQLVALLPDCRFSVVTLPPRHFSWRHRGNSLTLAHLPETAGDYDLLIATSMTDLSALRGMQPKLAGVPTILYWHENEFAYPDRGDPAHLIERQMTSIYSAVAADGLVFNSAYNRDSFLDGAQRLLAKMPDGVPVGIVASLRARSEVLPIAIGADCQPADQARAPFTLTWNHRWEHDKGLVLLQEIIKGIVTRDLPVTVNLIGQPHQGTEAIMGENRALLAAAGKLGAFGYVERRPDYINLLQRSHVLLSTARHDFQGLAVQEGIACGATPLVPDGLVYPEYVPPECRFQTADDALRRLAALAGSRLAPPAIDLPGIADVQAAWQRLIQRMVIASGAG